MTGFWIGLLFIACLIVQQQGVLTYFMTPNCGRSYPRPTQRINNGKTAVMGTAPFMAFLYVKNRIHCGGTIITKRYILTAGHCLKKGLKVRLGEYDTRTNPDCDDKFCFPRIRNYEIEKLIPYEGYDNYTLANDIALLKLKGSIIFNANTQPVCLVQSSTHLPKIYNFHAFGWGKIANGSVASVLQTTKLDNYRKSYCNSLLNDTLTKYQFCAGASKSDTCNGDSGGPLVTHIRVDRKFLYVQLGLVSFGAENCTGFGVYTFVPNYMPWILNTIQHN